MKTNLLNKLRNAALGTLIASTLAACASNDDPKKQLELLAKSRANILGSELPIEAGPLSIMRATAKSTTIELMMVYNQDAPGAKPTGQVMNNSIRHYCTNTDTLANMEVGLSYRIKMRNSRGQLMVDELVTYERCQLLMKNN